MVIALAGRRIDAPDAEIAGFPVHMTEKVRQRLRRLFLDRSATVLVTSGACGADLLALEVAGGLGLHRRMVLPFEPERFRSTSVTDRSDVASWGGLFDAITGALEPEDIIVLSGVGDGSAAFAAVNEAILEQAGGLAGSGDVLAVVVREGASRGDGDLTAAFADSARERGLEVAEVPTT